MITTPQQTGVWLPQQDQWRELFPFESHFLERPEGKIHYIDQGPRDPHGHDTSVLCVHGNPTWSFLWRDLVRDLSANNLRVIAPDHQGCGLSDRPSHEQYGYHLADRVADLDALVKVVIPQGPIHLVVHDWGGMIGMTWACQPENRARIRSITAMNTACFLLPEGRPFPWMLRVLKSFPQLARWSTKWLNLFARTAANTCTVTPLPKPIRQGFLAPYSRPELREATHWFVQDIPELPSDPSYNLAINTDKQAPETFAETPIFLPWGLRDYVFDKAFLEEWLRRFPQAVPMPLKNAGHYVLEDGGSPLIAAIRNHILEAERLGRLDP
jgi:haloalkane dehalogenase